MTPSGAATGHRRAAPPGKGRRPSIRCAEHRRQRRGDRTHAASSGAWRSPCPGASLEVSGAEHPAVRRKRRRHARLIHATPASACWSALMPQVIGPQRQQCLAIQRGSSGLRAVAEAMGDVDGYIAQYGERQRRVPSDRGRDCTAAAQGRAA
ncbi:hypothetical protein VB716_12360 [Synechococcus sp. CCY9201]|nr:hypothetical protein [Synechococcus sp. CCY9201]